MCEMVIAGGEGGGRHGLGKEAYEKQLLNVSGVLDTYS